VTLYTLKIYNGNSLVANNKGKGRIESINIKPLAKSKNEFKITNTDNQIKLQTESSTPSSGIALKVS
jgi:hypothetical protein